MALVVKHNERGFEVLPFEDLSANQCSLQKSSLAFEDCVWFGANEYRMHLTKDMVRTLLHFMNTFSKKGKLRLAAEEPYFEQEGFTIAKNSENQFQLQFQDRYQHACTLKMILEGEEPALLFRIINAGGVLHRMVLDQNTTAHLLPFLERFAIYGHIGEDV
jgi:hypothetical protein